MPLTCLAATKLRLAWLTRLSSYHVQVLGPKNTTLDTKTEKQETLTKKETAWRMHRASDVAAVDVAAAAAAVDVAAAFPLELTHGVTFVDASQSVIVTIRLAVCCNSCGICGSIK